MNTTPTIHFNEDGPDVGVATARLLLKHAKNLEAQGGCDELAEVARKQALNELTGASIQLPPTSHIAEEAVVTNALETDGALHGDSHVAKSAYD